MNSLMWGLGSYSWVWGSKLRELRAEPFTCLRVDCVARLDDLIGTRLILASFMLLSRQRMVLLMRTSL